LSSLAEDADDGAAGRLVILRIAGNFDHDFVVFFGTAGGGIVNQNGAEKSFSLGLDEPGVLSALKCSDKTVAAPFNNLNDSSAVSPLAVPPASADDLGLNDIAAHGAVDVLGGDIEVAVGVWCQGHQKAESAGIGAEGADDAVCHGGKGNVFSGIGDDLPAFAKLVKGGPEGGCLLTSDAEIAG